MRRILPIDEEAIARNRNNEAPYDPLHITRHALTEEHHPDRCHQRRHIECTRQQVRAEQIAHPVLLKVVKVGRHMMDRRPHERRIARDKHELHQTSYHVCRSALSHHTELLSLHAPCINVPLWMDGWICISALTSL